MTKDSEKPAEKSNKAVFWGVFVLSLSTLVMEIAWTRILSVTLWYHFAYMVLSTALFGMGFAGVLLSLRQRPELISDRLVSLLATATPISFVLGYILFNLVPYEPFSLGSDAMQWLYMPLSYLAVTLPFFFSGCTIAAVLTKFAGRVHKLYLFDLAGAGAGCIAVVWALPALGGPGAVFAAGAGAAVAGTLLAWERGRFLRLFSLGTAAILALASTGVESLFPVRISHNKVTGGKVPVERLIRDKRFHKYSAWNTLARIDVIEFRDKRRRVHRSVLIDGGTAVTRLAHPGGPLASLGPTDDDQSFFTKLLGSPSVLVVGSGGGWEVLSDLRNGASKITAVEINPDINYLVTDLMADFTGGLYQDPRVEVHTDEARSFIERTRKRYEIIKCPHTISNAAMASGSLSLAENYLLTLQAFESYMAHLAPGGLLLLTRPEAHVPRLFVTARKALQSAGMEHFDDKILAWRSRSKGLSFYAGFALRPSGFSDKEVDSFASLLERLGMEALYLPGRSRGRSYYRELLTARDPTAVSIPFNTILVPATDDRPFFNRRVSFKEITLEDLSAIFSQGYGGRMALEDRPVAEAALIVLVIEVGLIGILLILLPLAVFKKRALDGRGRLKTLASFAGLGVAYMVVEVGLIQRLTLYLGRPVIVFSTVLGSLLVFSGFGSHLAGRFRGRLKPRWTAAAAGAAAAVTAVLAPALVDVTLAAPALVRVLLAVMLLAPAGLLMGMTFPILVSQLDETHPERIPWAYGMNGFASVVGSVSAVLLGMTSGYTFVILCGVLAYFAVALVGDLK